MNRVGSEEALALRTAAAQLENLDNISSTSHFREILHDISEALDSLRQPVAELLDDHPMGNDYPDWPGEMEVIKQALATAASGLRYAAQNV